MIKVTKSLGLGLAALAMLAAAFVTTLTPTAASAASCHRYDVGLTNNTAYFTNEYLNYWYTPKLTVPSSSGCSGIYITNVAVPGDSTHSYTCINARVRFYPSSGGSWATAYKTACTGTSLVALATDVLNGTKYRVESYALSNRLYRPYYTIYD